MTEYYYIENIVPILISTLILGQAWIVSLHVGSWVNPSSVYGAFWFLYTLIPLIAFPTIEISSIALFYIFLTCLVFSLSIFFLHPKNVKKIDSRTFNSLYRTKFLKNAFYILGLLCLCFGVTNWYAQGIQASDLFNILEVAQEYMAKRYSGEIQSNAFSMLFNSLVYTVPAIGGLLFGADRRTPKFRYLILSFIPAILVTLIEANKGTFFLVAAYFWGGLLVTKLSNRDKSLFTTKGAKRLLSYSPYILILIIFSFLSRGIDIDNTIWDIANKLLYYFRSYSSGHLYAFADWMSFYLDDSHRQIYHDLIAPPGFYTFMSIFKFAGIDIIVPDGVFDEYFKIDDLLQTNIYTYYRGLIIDFGLYGSVFFVFCFGLILNVSYVLALKRQSDLFNALFISFVGFVYTSFIISIFIWNSPFVCFSIVYLVLHTNRYCFQKSQAVKSNMKHNPKPLVGSI